ncbi:glycoside hydrolase family 3 protein [Serpula lacrymans var. lacrymans S7.3]|uniref:Glycoside hydrolase family 3 protein n=2 Tax=Serpula lacrymans var. lacrymans TaxID=341189 RepID=F8Q9T9_SERL3|nr:glycoside hydrolase family 3 protein [Serpula lacrymans var. lacrymans S7.9]EGN94844.1 glycoside hydrolase family 3 protein [Serpula lacrymans var. lacrymans S7.3]EGO20343.1 glycoside hydrolase family 3 protein [Serpula lacrymans var. lacrymans S7.9]
MPELTEEIKRRIGQHFVFGFHGHELSEDVKILIRDYHVGNIILMKRNVQSVKQVHGLVQQLQQLAKDSGQSTPLMIGIDQENGLVSAFSSTAKYVAGTQFPGAMALAATGSPSIAEKCSAASGREMHLAGINWAYSPVADVNSDPRNPVIGVRSFGDDPEEVGQYAKAVSRGLTSAGVAPSAKHFPGHGDTHVDSHLALPVIKKSKADILKTELAPFRALVADNIATVMTGHMALPLVTGDDTPCSLSKAITTDLLRDEMGYTGVIVTDCLEMDAVAEKYGSQKGAVMSLQAGADVVMICHTMERQRGAVEEAYQAVANGTLSLDSLKVSEDRISALKSEFAGTWDHVLNQEFDEQTLAALTIENAELSSSSYSASVALIRGPVPQILGLDGDILLFTPEMESLNKAVDDAEGVLRNSTGQVRNTAGPHFLAFAQSIARRKSSQHIVYSSLAASSGELPPEVATVLPGISAVIFATRNADRSRWQLDYLRKLRENVLPFVPAVLLATCAPYDLMKDEDIKMAYLATFEYTPAALEAATAVIFGEKEAKGRVPVLGGDVLKR